MTEPQPVTSPRQPHPDLYLSTPLTTIGVFVAIIRERFSETYLHEPILHWAWQDNKKATGIFIESGFDEDIEARNVRPGVWVDQLQHVFGRVSVGDRDQMPVYQPARLENFYAIAEMDMVIDCTATKRAESMMVGSLVQEFIHLSSDLIQADFGFRGISPVIMGRTTLYEADRTLWNTEIQFRVEYERRWRTIPFAPVLDAISLTLQDKTDPEQYFRKIAMRD